MKKSELRVNKVKEHFYQVVKVLLSREQGV
jgi:hypothetical protein